jgi:DNA-binding LytR/AlgR family response regulator
MKLMVVKLHNRTGEDTDFVEIDINDVNYFDLWKKGSGQILAYHTSEGSYLALSTLKEAHAVFKIYGFELFDSSTGVNKHKVRDTELTEDGSIVNFNDGSYVFVRKKIYF